MPRKEEPPPFIITEAMYSSGAPPPVADHTHNFYPNFGDDFNSSLYPGWLLDQNFNLVNPSFLTSEIPVQRSPTNTASTHSTHSTRSSDISVWDERWLGHEYNSGTASGSSRTSDSERSNKSRKSEKRKRGTSKEQGVDPSSHRGIIPPHMGSQGLPSIPKPKHDPISHRPPHNPQKYLALATQYVYAASNRSRMLARVSVTDYRGNVLIDAFVRPTSEVSDMRWHITGLTADDLSPYKALDFQSVREQVRILIRHKIVVGHSLWTDFALLGITHPALNTRDVALYLPFHRSIRSYGITSLKSLVWHLMMRNMSQEHEHPVEEARAALDLFRSYEDPWEDDVRASGWPCALPPSEFRQYFS